MIGYRGLDGQADYPRRPHHRAASCPPREEVAACNRSQMCSECDSPWVLYGAMVGGPDQAPHVVIAEHGAWGMCMCLGMRMGMGVGMGMGMCMCMCMQVHVPPRYLADGLLERRPAQLGAQRGGPRLQRACARSPGMGATAHVILSHRGGEW